MLTWGLAGLGRIDVLHRPVAIVLVLLIVATVGWLWAGRAATR